MGPITPGANFTKCEEEKEVKNKIRKKGLSFWVPMTPEANIPKVKKKKKNIKEKNEEKYEKI